MSSGILARLSPYAKLGQIYRVQHCNSHDVSMTRLLRREWILKPAPNKREGVVRFIVGECSLIQNVNEALHAGYIVEIITGPKIRDPETREKMAGLLQTYTKDKLRIWVAFARPENHLCLINGNILYEDPHLAADDYGNATAIENADSYNINLLKNYFDGFKKNANFEDTPEKIRNMPTLLE